MFDGNAVGNLICVLYYMAFQACGCLMMNRILAKERFSVVFRMLMGSVAGTLALQWCPVIFAFGFGFTVKAHIAGILLWAVICFSAWRMTGAASLRGSHPYRKGKEWLRFVKDNPCIIFMAVMFCIFAYCLMTHTIAPNNNGSLHTGQSAFGDMNMHLGFITSIANQSSFPPDYSIYPGTRLAYPFLCDSISSSLYIWGASLRFAYNFPMLVAVLQLMGGFYCFIKYWFGRAVTALISWIMFFLDGGLGFVYFMSMESIRLNFTEFYHTPTSIGDMNFRWAQMITDMLIPQRATLFGWAVLFPLLAFFLQAVRKKSSLCFGIAGILAGTLPMIHTHSFLAFGLVCTMWLLFDCKDMCGKNDKKSYLLLAAFPAGLVLFSVLQKINAADGVIDKYGMAIMGAGVGLLFLYIMWCIIEVIRKKQIKTLFATWGLFLGIIIILAFPQLFTWTFGQAGTEGFVRGHFNWDNSGDQYIWFYLKNIGLTFAFFIPAYFFAAKKDLKTASPFLLIFFIAELVVFQPNVYDNNKLIFVAFVFMCGLAADFITRLFDKKWNKALKILAASAMVFVGTVSAVLSIGRECVSDYELYPAESVEACRFIEENTEKDAVILTASNHNNAVASLTGRNIVCGSGTFLHFHGIDFSEREQKLSVMYSDPVSNFDLYRMYNVGYVYVGGTEMSSFSVNTEELSRIAECIYSKNNVSIYKLTVR